MKSGARWLVCACITVCVSVLSPGVHWSLVSQHHRHLPSLPTSTHVLSSYVYMFQVFAIYNTFDLYAQVLIIILKPETLNKDVMIFTLYN